MQKRLRITKKVSRTSGKSCIRKLKKDAFHDKDIFNGVEKMRSRLKNTKSEQEVKMWTNKVQSR